MKTPLHVVAGWQGWPAGEKGVHPAPTGLPRYQAGLQPARPGGLTRISPGIHTRP